MNAGDLSAWANHLWQSTLFAGVAWLAVLALKNNRAAVRYRIWFAASVKFLIPFSFLTHLFKSMDWRPEPLIKQPEVLRLVSGIGQPFAMRVTPAASTMSLQSDPLAKILFVLWLCGFLFGLISLVIVTRRMRAVRQAAVTLDVPLPIRVITSSARLEPGILGLFRPVLFLPIGISKNLTREQLDMVVMHELCHVRRKDNLTAAIHMTVELIYWFHPVVWWLRTGLLTERERACDEEVLRLNADPGVYAEVILKVCRLYLESPLVCASGVTGAELQQRILAIVTGRPGEYLSGWKKLLLVGAGSAILAASFLFSDGTLGGFAVAGARVYASQSPVAQSAPTFEAATIKLNRSGSTGGGMNVFPARIKVVNSSLKFCIQLAWNVQEFQVAGGEPWMNAERYDIEAVAAEPVKSDQARKMFQALLIERFGLTIHREKREKSGYLLVSGRGGPKLPAPTDDPDVFLGRTPAGDQTLKAQNITLGQLARVLSDRLGATVVDQTGVDGRYDLSLEWAPDSTTHPLLTKSGMPAAPLPPDAKSGPSLSTALQERLGLKLEAHKVPVEVIIIDHASRPSAN